MELILYPLIGGALIGLSSSLMLGGLGRITGISGIIGYGMSIPKKDDFWRYFFVLGLITGGAILLKTNPSLFNYQFNFSVWIYIIAGLLVGFGTRLGSGCTSGHGVCGISRMARRSLLATITFIASGIITVAIKGALS